MPVECRLASLLTAAPIPCVALSERRHATLADRHRRWSGYAACAKRGYDHHAIAECGDPEMGRNRFHADEVSLVFSNLKTWLNGIHHGVSAKRLQAYLNEVHVPLHIQAVYPFNAFRCCSASRAVVEAPTYADLYSARDAPTCSGCLRLTG